MRKHNTYITRLRNMQGILPSVFTQLVIFFSSGGPSCRSNYALQSAIHPTTKVGISISVPMQITLEDTL
jgi:hypothetical protein